MRKNTVIYVILWLLLFGAVAYVSLTGQSKGESKVEPTAVPTAEPTAQPSPTPQEATVQVSEKMVGVWVPYMSLAAKDFKENFKEIVESAKKVNATALFVHIRPFCDALYKSKLYPWSHIVSGKQGVDPNFDPLTFMVEEAHKNSMELHGWINPMRVKSTETPSELSADNVYSQLKESNPYYFIETDSGIYLNPAYSYVRNLIADGAKEVVENYDVDGIHFDDYFYPSDIGNQDELAYFAYKDESDVPISLEDWRAANVNAMINQVYREIKNANKNVAFGISPQGNISNNYSLGADVNTWCGIKGYIDYICPQIYFSYENPALTYTDALKQWKNIKTYDGLKMYVGLALYKVGTDSDSGTWPKDKSIIEKQIADAEENGTDGVILFDNSDIETLFG